MVEDFFFKPNSCKRCSGFVVWVKERTYAYNSCYNCGAMEFEKDEEEESEDVDLRKVNLCDHCSQNEYVENIVQCPLPLCGSCYIEYLYKEPAKTTTSKNNRYLIKFNGDIISCLSYFNDNFRVAFEDYVYDKYTSGEHTTLHSLIRECNYVSGIPQIVVRNIVVAMDNIHTGRV